MARVELAHVEKTYPNGTRAVVDCSLAIADRELVVLVGPSGCGKSTLLRLVAGLEEPSGGTLTIGDTVVNELSPQARNVAMVFQDYALYPHMTVRRNLEFPLRMRGMPAAERDRQVERIAGLLDLGALLERLPKQLSGGQRQRVAMGRALVREPTVSLLDEPLSNLDAKLRVQVRAEIGDLQRRIGTTMIYVTHDQVEAMTLGDRVAVMDKGRLQQFATPREIYDRPANAFVAGFMGNPPMNLFATRLDVDPRGATTIAVGTQSIVIPPSRVPGSLGAAAGAQTITVGIRPEALALAPSDASAATSGGADATVSATVEHVEWLGHETLAHVHLDAGGGAEPVRLVARVPGMQPLAKEQEIRLRLDPARIYLFAADGRALS